MNLSNFKSNSNVLNTNNRESFLVIMEQRFLQKIKKDPYFRITATPDLSDQTKVDVQRKEILELLKNPTSYKRKSGWTINVIGNFILTQEGVENDDYSWRHLIFLKNGHLEFWAKIDESFCWRQNERDMKTHPRFYPYAVIEYPLSYFYLLKDLVRLIKIKTKILITGGYYNCRGCYLKPGHPDSIIFQDSRLYKPQYWEKDSPIELTEILIDPDFSPDDVAYKIVHEIYSTFGIEENYIPFVNENRKFNII